MRTNYMHNKNERAQIICTTRIDVHSFYAKQEFMPQDYKHNKNWCQHILWASRIDAYKLYAQQEWTCTDYMHNKNLYAPILCTTKIHAYRLFADTDYTQTWCKHTVLYCTQIWTEIEYFSMFIEVPWSRLQGGLDSVKTSKPKPLMLLSF